MSGVSDEMRLNKAAGPSEAAKRERVEPKGENKDIYEEGRRGRVAGSRTAGSGLSVEQK